MSKKQKLTKSILCAVMAASVVSISGNAFAYTAIDPKIKVSFIVMMEKI